MFETLLRLAQNRDYFVITTNLDHCFQKAGFDKKRLFHTQGDDGLFQCSGPCRPETWDNEGAIREMAAREKDMRIPSELISTCPHCGRPATTNLRRTINLWRTKAGIRRRDDMSSSFAPGESRKFSSWNWAWVITPRASSNIPSDR